MDLTPTTKTFGADDRTWLASQHGLDSTDSVKITVAGGDVTTYGTVLPSGVPLNVDGTINPNGTGKAVHGFLVSAIDISRGAGTYAGALLRHGQISDAARVAKGLVALTNDQKTSLAANADILVVA